MTESYMLDQSTDLCMCVCVCVCVCVRVFVCVRPLLSVEQQVFGHLGIFLLVGLENRQGLGETHQVPHRDWPFHQNALNPVVSIYV